MTQERDKYRRKNAKTKQRNDMKLANGMDCRLSDAADRPIVPQIRQQPTGVSECKLFLPLRPSLMKIFLTSSVAKSRTTRAKQLKPLQRNSSRFAQAATKMLGFTRWALTTRGPDDVQSSSMFNPHRFSRCRPSSERTINVSSLRRQTVVARCQVVSSKVNHGDQNYSLAASGINPRRINLLVICCD